MRRRRRRRKEKGEEEEEEKSDNPNLKGEEQTSCLCDRLWGVFVSDLFVVLKMSKPSFIMVNEILTFS